MGTGTSSATTQCYAPAEVLTTGGYRGEKNIASLMGMAVEKVIEADYLLQTRVKSVIAGKILELPLGALFQTDWFDFGGRLKPYIDALVANYPLSNRGEIEAYLNAQKGKEGYAMPDILTFNGLNLKLRGFIPVRDRHEFYEIKPDSPSGLEAGLVKLVKIPRLYRRFRMAYKPGDSYPIDQVRRMDLPMNKAFLQLVRVTLARHKMRAAKLSLVIRRPEESPGLLLWKICITTDDDEERKKKKALNSALAKMFFGAYALHHTAELQRAELLKELEENEGPLRMPRVACEFDAMKALQPQLAALTDAIIARGLGVPGETYLLCADEHYFKSVLTPPTEDVAGELWTRVLAQARALLNIALGSAQLGDAVWQKSVQPYVVKLEDIPRVLEKLFPGLREAVNQVLLWMRAHPVQTVALVMVPIVMTAGIAAIVEPALLAGALISATEIEAGGTVSASMMGSMAAEPTLATALGTRAAGTALVDTLPTLVRTGTALEGAAVNDTVAFTVRAASQLSPSALKTAMGSGIAASLLLSLYPKTAQAAPAKASPPSAPSTTPDQVSQLSAAFNLALCTSTIYGCESRTAPSPKDPIVLQVLSGLYMVRAINAVTLREGRNGKQLPAQGDPIDLHYFAEFKNPLALDNPHILGRHVGTVTLK